MCDLKKKTNEHSVVSVFRSYPSPVQNGGPNGTTTMSCATSQGKDRLCRSDIAAFERAGPRRQKKRRKRKNSETILLIQCVAQRSRVAFNYYDPAAALK